MMVRIMCAQGYLLVPFRGPYALSGGVLFGFRKKSRLLPSPEIWPLAGGFATKRSALCVFLGKTA